MRHSLPATLALEIEAQSPAWPAWIDISQLENAIINLVMNARDAMEGQTGIIKIRTGISALLAAVGSVRTWWHWRSSIMAAVCRRR